MADGDAVTDIVDLSGNGKGVALNVFPWHYLPVLDDTVIDAIILPEGVMVYADQSEEVRVGDGATLGGVALSSGSSGALVVVTPQQFGAVSGSSAAVNGPAFVAAIAYLKSIATDIGDPYHKGSAKLFIPAGDYNLGATTLDITHTLIIEGEASLAGYGTMLRWAENTTGIRLQAYNTSGAGSVGGSHHSGSYTIIRNLYLRGPVAGTEGGLTGGEAEYHAIHAKSNYIIEDCYIDGFRGDGVYVSSTAGAGDANEGNTNCSFINRLFVTNVRNGVYIDGADANAGLYTGIIGNYCRQHTIWDSSFLGNTHIAHHSANAGLVVGVPASVVSYSGNRYYVIMGQATGASTNAPSGTTADNQWWAYIGAGGTQPTSNINTWTNGATYREGGGYRTDNGNARNVFSGCYQEGGEATSQFVSPTMTFGGNLFPRTTGNVYGGSFLIAPSGAILGISKVAAISGGGSSAAATNLFTVHNNGVLASTLYAQMNISVGFETDGVTPCSLAAISAYGFSGVPSTTGGALVLSTRTYGTGVMTERVMIDGNYDFKPAANNANQLGTPGNRWSTINGYTGDFTTQVKVNGVKVLGAQGAAVADATDAASAITQLNALLARCRAHGLIA